MVEISGPGQLAGFGSALAKFHSYPGRALAVIRSTEESDEITVKGKIVSLPIYDYAPDVRVIGEWLYFTASNRGVPCSFYRTKDPIHGPYEEIKGTMEYWDPNLFLDDDGRMYFYWGCDNRTPIWGVELDPQTMSPIGEKKDLIKGNPWSRVYGVRMGCCSKTWT